MTAGETMADTFTAVNGTAPDSSKWTVSASGGAAASASANRMDLSVPDTDSASVSVDANAAAPADSDTLSRYVLPNPASDAKLRVYARQSSAGSHRVELRGDKATGYFY